MGFYLIGLGIKIEGELRDEFARAVCYTAF